MNIQFAAYLRFERDHSQIKHKDGTLTDRKTPRYNLKAYAGYWGGTDKLKTAKGEIYVNLIPNAKDHSISENATEYRLQIRPAGVKATINLTGLRLDIRDQSGVIYGSGEPIQSATYKNVPNPLFEERKDGFLFIFPKEPQRCEYFEMLVVANEQPMIDAYRTKMALGLCDEQIELIRKIAKVIEE